MKRKEDSLRDLWDNIKCNNIRIIGFPEGEEREKGPEKISEEIIVENFPNMGKNKHLLSVFDINERTEGVDKRNKEVQDVSP